MKCLSRAGATPLVSDLFGCQASCTDAVQVYLTSIWATVLPHSGTDSMVLVWSTGSRSATAACQLTGRDYLTAVEMSGHA
ncbi:hypothetical protein HK405_009580, partial [Cladochytrium tenue]